MLAPGGVFRVLMPSLELLVRTGRDFDAQKTGDFFAQNFGIGFGADATNLSQYREHSYSEAYLVNRTDRALPIDSSMRSTHHTSFIAAPSRHSGELTDSLRFDPASRSSDHFTTGPAEIFFREEAAADA